MKLLEDKVAQEGKVYPGNVLKVDHFLNHQLDIPLLCQLGQEIHRRFADEGVTKILTVEASGIALAALCAQCFPVPVVFAKKKVTSNLAKGLYSTKVASFTHKCVYNVVVEAAFLSSNDRVLLIDDFLADGNALRGLRELCRQAGAQVVGAGIAVEKGFQQGGDKLRSEGMRVESLAIVDSMSPEGGIQFRPDPYNG